MPATDARTPAAIKPALTDAEAWDMCLAKLLGPRLLGEPEERRQRQALELAAAALRFAGEHTMAANLLNEA